MSKFLTLAFLLMLSSASAVAEPLSILVNADNPVMALSDQDLASCFLKSRSAWPENFPMHPVEIYGDNPAKNFFSQRILQKDPAALQAYWTSAKLQKFILPPLTVPTLEQLLSVVAFDPGAIAYVPTSQLKGKNLKNVRVVRTVE